MIKVYPGELRNPQLVKQTIISQTIHGSLLFFILHRIAHKRMLLCSEQKKLWTQRPARRRPASGRVGSSPQLAPPRHAGALLAHGADVVERRPRRSARHLVRRLYPQHHVLLLGLVAAAPVIAVAAAASPAPATSARFRSTTSVGITIFSRNATVAPAAFP